MDPHAQTSSETEPLKGSARWSFLLTGPWIAAFLLTCVFAALALFLGQWQMDRREARIAKNASVLSNYERSPLPFDQARPLLNDLPESKQWTPVRVTGQYLRDQQLIVRNRPLDGQPGYQVLVPFRTNDGQIIAVDRGWVPLASSEQGKPTNVPAAPEGSEEIVIRLKNWEPKLNRQAPEGQVASINAEEVSQRTGLKFPSSAYGLMASESPAPASAPRPMPKPETDEGSHLSYAMQWVTFALLAFIALGYTIRKHTQDVDEDRAWKAERQALALSGDKDGNGNKIYQHSAYRPSTKKTRSASSKRSWNNEEEEDALVDALKGTAPETSSQPRP